MFPVGLSLNTHYTATWHANSVFSQLYDDTQWSTCARYVAQPLAGWSYFK